MPRSRTEMSRRRRMQGETIPPPPLVERVINGVSETQLRASFDEVVSGAFDNPELCARSARFFETFAVAEARDLIEELLSVPGWTLDKVESAVDQVLVAGESLAAAITEKRDEEFARTLRGESAS